MSTINVRMLQGSSLSEPVEIPEELQILEGVEEPLPGKCVFRLLSPEHGDQRVVWDSGILAEIRAASKLFVELVKKGLTPFKVGTDGKQTSEVMREFDPEAGEVIFIPTNLVVGG